MHSNIYCVRPVTDGELCKFDKVDEEQICDQLYPNYLDYCNEVPTNKWSSNIDWLCNVHKFIISSQDKRTGDWFITVKVNDAIPFFEKRLDHIKDIVDSLTVDKFIDPFSMELYYLNEAIEDKHGFWMVDTNDRGQIEETSSFDNWIASVVHYAREKHVDTVAFRVQNIFDYHF